MAGEKMGIGPLFYQQSRAKIPVGQLKNSVVNKKFSRSFKKSNIHSHRHFEKNDVWQIFPNFSKNPKIKQDKTKILNKKKQTKILKIQKMTMNLVTFSKNPIFYMPFWNCEYTSTLFYLQFQNGCKNPCKIRRRYVHLS